MDEEKHLAEEEWQLAMSRKAKKKCQRRQRVENYFIFYGGGIAVKARQSSVILMLNNILWELTLPKTTLDIIVSSILSFTTTTFSRPSLNVQNSLVQQCFG
jgi:hypothetical protein